MPCLSTILPKYFIESLSISHFDVCTSAPTSSYTQILRQVSQCGPLVWVLLLPRHPHSTLPDCRISSSRLSARVPSTAETWLWHCKVQTASVSIETDPTRRQTLSCPCPASSAVPAKKPSLNQESLKFLHHLTSRGSHQS